MLGYDSFVQFTGDAVQLVDLGMFNNRVIFVDESATRVRMMEKSKLTILLMMVHTGALSGGAALGFLGEYSQYAALITKWSVKNLEEKKKRFSTYETNFPKQKSKERKQMDMMSVTFCLESAENTFEFLARLILMHGDFIHLACSTFLFGELYKNVVVSKLAQLDEIRKEIKVALAAEAAQIQRVSVLHGFSHSSTFLPSVVDCASFRERVNMFRSKTLKVNAKNGLFRRKQGVISEKKK